MALTPTAELRRCRRLIQKIERLGGPPAHLGREFAQVKATLHGGLGFPFLAVIGGGMLLSWLGYVLWETKDIVTDPAKRVATTMATAGQVLIWGGVAWLGLQAIQR